MGWATRIGVESEWLVVEADESDRSMLSLDVDIAVLTNVELDHHATYASLAQLREAFRAFAARAAQAIVVWDRAELLELMPDGPAELARFDVAAPQLDAGGSSFRLARRVGASVGAGRTQRAERRRGAGGGAARRGGRRRRDRRSGGISRRRTALSGARAKPPRRARCTTTTPTTRRRSRRRSPPRARSRPSGCSRCSSRICTRARGCSRGEFGRALAHADVVVVLDVYAARERAEDHPGVSGLLIAEAAADAAPGRPVYWLPSFDAAASVLDGLLEAGDVCLVMGAGDVDALGRRLVVA